MSTPKLDREALNVIRDYIPEIVPHASTVMTTEVSDYGLDVESAQELHRKVSALREVLSFLTTGQASFDDKVRELRKIDSAWNDVPTFRTGKGGRKASNPFAGLFDD